uniref:Uncharacterized protein n=1 Tax=Rhizophora mucronata TaxID=61149 RepID=A0A2P2NBU8_RHIMU
MIIICNRPAITILKRKLGR